MLPGPIGVVLDLYFNEDGLAWVGSVDWLVSFNKYSLIHSPFLLGIPEFREASSSTGTTLPLTHEHLSHVLELLTVLLHFLLLFLDFLVVLLSSILLALLSDDLFHVV